MDQKYKINPCKACEKKLNGTTCNVNTMNDCCYSTLAAFSGATSSNSIVNDEAANNCKECVQKVMDGMGVFGRSPCDLKLSAPPLWQQSPHYVPNLLNSGKTPEEARDLCMRMCQNAQYISECQSNCKTDYNAIEQPPKTVSDGKNSNISQTKNSININTSVHIFVILFLIIMVAVWKFA